MRKPELEFHEPLVGWQKTNGDAERGIWEQILAADPREDFYPRYVRVPSTWHASRALPRRGRLSHARHCSSEVGSKYVISRTSRIGACLTSSLSPTTRE